MISQQQKQPTPTCKVVVNCTTKVLKYTEILYDKFNEYNLTLNSENKQHRNCWHFSLVI